MENYFPWRFCCKIKHTSLATNISNRNCVKCRLVELGLKAKATK
jgi:hypothetical protein